MRAESWAPWATCALALILCVAVPTRSFAEPTRRSVAACAVFDQVDKDHDKVGFTIRNTCTIPLDCAVSWRLVCAPDSKKRRAEHPSRTTFAVSAGATEGAEASAAVCGDDGWTINAIQWSCQPNKD